MSKTFSEEVLEASEQSATSGWSTANRKDYTNLHTIAIDAPHTTEVDDAFAIDGNRIVVFIADADALVPVDTPVDEEARRRVSTLYLPDKIIPMLPARVGQGSASLSVDVDRPSLAMSFRLDAEGGLVDFTVEEAICRLNTRLSYVDTDLLLQGKGPEEMRTAVSYTHLTLPTKA